MKKLIVLAGIVVALTACGEKKDNVNTTSDVTTNQTTTTSSTATTTSNTVKRIDATDQERFQQSVAAITQTLSDDDKAKFGAGILVLTAQIATESKGDDAKAAQLLKEKFDGKTAEEIIKVGSQQ